MIILRQKTYSDYSFMDKLKGKPEQDLKKKIMDFEKTSGTYSDPKFSSVASDLKKWISFLHKEEIKSQKRFSVNPEMYIMGYNTYKNPKSITIARTYSSQGGDYRLIYDSEEKDYKVIMKTSGWQIISKGINKLFGDEGKVHYTTTSLKAGIMWMLNNIRTVVTYY